MSSPHYPQTSFAHTITHNILWAGFSQIFLFVLGLLKTIVLYRYIGPEYAGLIAGAVVWSSYFSIARFELRAAVLNSSEEPLVLETQFWLESLTAFSGLGLALAVKFIFNDLMSPITWALTFILLGLNVFEALASTSRYLTEKRLRQDIIGRWTLIASLLSLLIPVVLALREAPLAALALEIILPTLVVSGGAVLFVRWKPSFAINYTELKKQWRLGFTLWTTGLLGKITFQLDDWLVFNLQRPNPIIWLEASTVAEGFYSRAYNAGKMPLEVMGGMIGTVALSLYSASNAQSQELLYKTYQQLTRLLIWIIAISSTVALITAEEIVFILFGSTWLPLVPLFRLMFLFIVGRPILQNNAQLLITIEREKDFRYAMFVQAIFIIMTCPIAVYFWGAAGAAATVSLMSLLGVILTEKQVHNFFQKSMWHIYFLPFGTSAFISLGLIFITPLLTTNLLSSLLFKGLISSAIFGLLLFFFEKENIKQIWFTLRENFPDTRP